MKEKLKPILLIAILAFAIFGNPLYQTLSFILCSELGYSTKLGTNVTQVDSITYCIILILIFIIRFIIYTSIFHLQGKIKPFENISKFIILFINCHVFQFLGLITLWVWLMELEGNIIGFFVVPISFLIGMTLSILTIIKIVRIPKKWKAPIIAKAKI